MRAVGCCNVASPVLHRHMTTTLCFGGAMRRLASSTLSLLDIQFTPFRPMRSGITFLPHIHRDGSSPLTYSNSLLRRMRGRCNDDHHYLRLMGLFLSCLFLFPKSKSKQRINFRFSQTTALRNVCFPVDTIGQFSLSLAPALFLISFQLETNLAKCRFVPFLCICLLRCPCKIWFR